MSPTKHTLQPYVTGSSVLGIKYRDGVMLAADTLLSYGRTAQYKNMQRIVEVSSNTLVAASGEYSDFQYIQQILSELETEDWMHHDGVRLGPKEYGSYLSRVMYNRRSKVNPLWNTLIVGGYRNGEKYLQYVDLQGTTYQENYVATGFGMHLAIPIIRKEWREDMTEAEAKALLEKCLQVLFYRDCVAFNRVQIATCTSEGNKIGEPFTISSKWDHKMWTMTGAELAGGKISSDSW